MSRAFLVLTFLSLLFSGCTLGRNRPAVVFAPVATVSSDTARVGEFVQVTVTGGYELTENTTAKEETIPGAVFGMCLIPSEELIDRFEGGCNTLSLSEGFVTADDAPLYEVETITVRRGEKVKLSHSVQLTATEARGVTVVGYYGRLDEDGQSIEPIGGITGQRAFVAFQ